MTHSAAGPQPSPAVAAAVERGLWRAPAGRAILVAALVALALRLYVLSRPGFLMGVIEYDDGTDFGSAVRLVHGALPYRDFIMVQPPGITLLMVPIALAGKGLGTAGALAVGRVVTAFASAAGVVLAGLLVRHRGLLATIITTGLLAVFPDSVLAAKTVLLEPWLVLFCLAGALAVVDRDRLAGGRRLAAGGLALGFAGAIKVWAILPVIMIVILILAAREPGQPRGPRLPRRLRFRRAGGFAGGVALGFLVPVLPFAALAPRSFYQSVVVAQLVRVDLVRIPLGIRLTDLTGLTHLGDSAPALLLGVAVILIIALSAGACLLATRLTGERPAPLEWFALGTFALVVAAFLWPSDFYYHYAAFLAPFLGMAIALPLARLVAAVPAPAARLPRFARGERMAAWLRPPRAVWLAAAVFVALALGQGASEMSMTAAVPPSDIATARQLIRPGACVLSDQMSYVMAADRFVSRYQDCSVMVDGVGTDYALSAGRNGLTGAGDSPAVRAVWMSAFRAAQYVWLTGVSDRRIPWTPQLRGYFLSHFVPLTEGPDWLYVRNAASG